MSIEVRGIEDVQKFLTQLDADVQQKVLRSALRAEGQVFKAAVEAAAPVKVEPGGVLPDGALKTDVILRVGTDDAVRPAAAVGFGSLTRRVAGWVEYGHRLIRRHIEGKIRLRVKGGGTGVQIGTVSAHPFIRPAFEASVAEANAAFAEKFSQELRKR